MHEERLVHRLRRAHRGTLCSGVRKAAPSLRPHKRLRRRWRRRRREEEGEEGVGLHSWVGCVGEWVVEDVQGTVARSVEGEALVGAEI